MLDWHLAIHKSFLRKTVNFNCGIYIYTYEFTIKDDRESWSILPPHKNDNFYDNMCSVAGCKWPDNSPSWVWRIRGLYSRNWMVSRMVDSLFICIQELRIVQCTMIAIKLKAQKISLYIISYGFFFKFVK